MSGNYGQADNYKWNFYNRIREGHTTNNPSKGANNRFLSRCKTSHPGIYPFIGVIRRETQGTYDKMEQFESGNLHRVQTSRSMTMQMSRVKLLELHEAGTIPLKKYLRSQGVLNTKVKSNRQRRVPEGREAAGEAGAGGAVNVQHPRTASPSAAGPSWPTSFLSAPPPRVNLYPSTSDEELVITPPFLSTSHWVNS